ncbi:MAG: hypothetical protein WDN04_24315 [Rhodospirillales bacterium]
MSARRFELAGADYLVRVRNPILGMDKPQLRAELENLLVGAQPAP